MTYRAAIVKKNIELFLMWPFVLLGKIAGRAYSLDTKHKVFLFFSSADIGGSIKVNADIIQCIKDQKPLIIFSKTPKNNEFISLFRIEGVRILDLHRYIDNKLFHFINFFFRGVLAVWINKANKPVVFGGESLFFYKILPHIKAETKIIELCHMNTWINFTQAFIKEIDYRIFSTKKIKRDVEEQYKKNKIGQKYFDRLLFIDNKIEIPPFKEVNNEALEVVYVGRGAPQKRVHLIAEIAKQLYYQNSNIHFSFVGDVTDVVPVDTKTYATLYGNIKDEEKLHKIYMQSDVLILTSAYEGLPIVVMDMMARGKVVLSTAVDGIPDYITHYENGLLIHEKEEDKIVESGVNLLKTLETNSALKKIIGHNSYEYAKKKFNANDFCIFYRGIFTW